MPNVRKLSCSSSDKSRPPACGPNNEYIHMEGAVRGTVYRFKAITTLATIIYLSAAPLGDLFRLT
jgi:hypothetical protein